MNHTAIFKINKGKGGRVFNFLWELPVVMDLAYTKCGNLWVSLTIEPKQFPAYVREESLNQYHLSPTTEPGFKQS